MIGFYWTGSITKEQSEELATLVHQLQPNCLVSGRVGHNAGDYDSAGDNQISVGKIKPSGRTNPVAASGVRALPRPAGSGTMKRNANPSL